MSPKRVILNTNIFIIIYIVMLIPSNLFGYIDPDQSFTKGRMDNNIVDLSKDDVYSILQAIF